MCVILHSTLTTNPPGASSLWKVQYAMSSVLSRLKPMQAGLHTTDTFKPCAPFREAKGYLVDLGANSRAATEHLFPAVLMPS